MILEQIDERHLLADAIHAWFAVPQPHGWSRIEIETPPTDLINWWRKQPFARKVYWSDRSDVVEYAGVGVATTIVGGESLAPDLLASKIDPIVAAIGGDVKLFGGFRFNPKTEPEAIWAEFGVQHFTLPRIIRATDGERNTLAIHFNHEGDSDAQMQQLLNEVARLRYDDEVVNGEVPNPLVRDDIPNEARWHANIAAAHSAFERGEMSKIVLARKVTVIADDWLEPGLVLDKLKAVTPNSFHFCYQIDDSLAFVGASPERLYRRTGRTLFSDALAGTRKRGATPEEDQTLADELFNSAKERHEQGLVRESIVHDFEQLCDDVRVIGETRVLKLAQLQHLYDEIEGTLRSNVTGEQVMATLHPTPAVGGFPREKAVVEIERLEPFDRGWYAAPLGWVGVDSAEFCVAIRSALVDGQQIHAYSGAGIVPDSTAAAEWDEIENKLLNFRRALM